MKSRSPLLDLLRLCLKPSDPAFCEPLKANEKVTLLCLIAHANKQGNAWPSLATLAKGTGLSVRTVMRTLINLERGGMITRTRQDRQRPTVYAVTLLDPERWSHGYPDTEPDESETGQATVTLGHHDLTESTPAVGSQSHLGRVMVTTELSSELELLSAGEKSSLHTYAGVGAYEEPDSETDPEGFERWAIMQEAGI